MSLYVQALLKSFNLNQKIGNHHRQKEIFLKLNAIQPGICGEYDQIWPDNREKEITQSSLLSINNIDLLVENTSIDPSFLFDQNTKTASYLNNNSLRLDISNPDNTAIEILFSNNSKKLIEINRNHKKEIYEVSENIKLFGKRKTSFLDIKFIDTNNKNTGISEIIIKK